MVLEILSAKDIIFCHFVPFLLFYPTKNLKTQNFDKMKNNPGDIILNNFTKNHDHML